MVPLFKRKLMLLGMMVSPYSGVYAAKGNLHIDVSRWGMVSGAHHPHYHLH